MRLGIVSDIHGNVTALDAVMRDADPLGIDKWWALGDLVLFGPRPVEVLEILARLPECAFVRGNTDRYVLTGDQPPVHPTPEAAAGDPDLVARFGYMAASIGWTRGALTVAGWLDWLDRLDDKVRTDLPDGTRLLGVHASPRSDDGDGIDPRQSDDELAQLLNECDADMIVGGHTHQPTDRQVGAVRALNPGSAGLPKGGAGEARWMLIDADEHGVQVEQRGAAFDVDAAVADAHQRRHPSAPFFEAILRGRHPFAK